MIIDLYVQDFRGEKKTEMNFLEIFMTIVRVLPCCGI